MSGLIDANVNICSGSDLEDFGSITKAASAGGYTCIIDNPMYLSIIFIIFQNKSIKAFYRYSKPATTTWKNLKEKIIKARSTKSLNIDVGFWGGVTSDNHDELLPMANQGVCGFKAILNPQDSSPDFSHLSKQDLKNALDVLEETNCVFAVSNLILLNLFLPE